MTLHKEKDQGKICREMGTRVGCIVHLVVKHGSVKHVTDWQWSSFHHYVKMGIYDADWGEGIDVQVNKRNFGK